jgi:hypothetical protein
LNKRGADGKNYTNILVIDNNKENLQAKLFSVMKQLEAWFFIP